MTNEQWIDGMSKEELAFRTFIREATGLNCPQCVWYRKDKYGRFKCRAEEWIQVTCEKQFADWLKESVPER